MNASRWKNVFKEQGHLLIIVGVVGIAFLLIRPLFEAGHSPSRLSMCTNNLRHFGLALNTYLDVFHSFPPAYVADANGKPIHSWRVLLLPYFEESQLHQLYDQYDFNEPWNGPHNSKLAARMPALFHCPGDDDTRTDTSYVAVVGPQTAWPGLGARTIKTITDGLSKTIMIVEVADSGINWMEPRDLTFEQAVRGINVPRSKPGISSKHPGGANILFCDGSVHFLINDIPTGDLRALLTATGGEVVTIPGT